MKTQMTSLIKKLTNNCLLTVLVLALTGLAQAQLMYTTNNGAITITGYTGSPTTIVIPGTINGYPVTGIGSNAFYYCTSLTNLTIGNNVSSIASQAFYYCIGLTSITLGNGVTSIGYFAFGYCTSLPGVTIPNSVTSIANYAFSDSSLTSVTIPNNVVSIGYGAFDGCSHLTNVTIGSGAIGQFAFSYDANLTSVTIGNGVTGIGSYAFFDSTDLKAVYFQGNAPVTNNDSTVFYYDSPTIYYLPGTIGSGSTFDAMPTALWYQPMPLILTSFNGNQNFGFKSNQFGFTVSWATNLSVIVEATTNLANPTWTPLATNALVSGTNYFSDSQSGNYRNRYYRIHSP